jgi:hypothetical protein
MNRAMKDIDEIRRDNLRALEAEAGNPTKAAATAGMKSTSQWSNLRKGASDSKTGKARGLRKSTARKIERAFGKPDYWLDIDHSTHADPEEQRVQLPALKVALEVVMNALAASVAKAELKQLIPMLVDTNAQAYRDRLFQLLTAPTLTPTVARVVEARLSTETSDLTKKNKETPADAGPLE